MLNERPKVLVLLSGGLDSTLAVKAMLEQGFKYGTGEYHDGGKLFSKYK